MDSATKKIFRENFAEINPALRPEEAVVEANRCLYCYDAPCIKACPTHIDIPRFIKQIASNNLVGSAKTILEANALGHSCARACPVEVLCEGSCVYHDWQEKPISIASLQRRATDHANATGLRPFKPAPDNGHRVAVIGGGPAGLSCASYLRRLGYAVVLFEKHKKVPGGLNTFGIAEYKMDQKVSLDEIKRLFQLGIDVKMGVEVGRDIAPERLLKDFEAVFIGIGLGETHSLGIPGEGLRGVWDALSFIRFVKDRDLGPIGKSDCTVVIGAGNTSIDAVTQSKRTGAKRVVMAYRRSEAEMGAYGFEYALAKSDGAEFLWHASPVRILGKGRVEGIEFARTKAVGGKLKVTGSTFKVACDRVIKAIGQTKHFALAKAFDLKLASDGRISVEPETLRASHPRVFAGGDAINGGKEVVNAAADGKRAAWAIHRALQPGVPAPAGNDYWISTIDGRKVAPIMPKLPSERTKAHG
ncbi:MAG: NAD(P)-dependent oxidoreductase [Elusimicrobia bacterium]|nr:NAD(P)-dependent oxidoreductase [Elusimicrobiota bacterium]